MLLRVSIILTCIQFIRCQDCDGVHDPDVKYFDIRLPDMEVPNKITTYVCQQYKVPNDDTYHAIAFEPLIVNPDVMHHMLLFGCPEETEADTPHHCGSGDERCRSWLAQWTMGVQGQVCAHPGTGVRFGKGSFKSMSLQIHWNNANKANNMSDNSGMRIYYTRKLRRYDVGNVQIGQSDLEIPSGMKNYAASGGCSGNCTSHILPRSIFLTRTYIHMHYLGVRGIFEVYRNGKFIRTIADDINYQYQLSPIHVHKQPVEIKPGDEIRLTCVFDTETGDRYRDHPVFYGEGSDAEMCFAFVTYYPRAEGLDQCIQFDKYDVCGPTGGSLYGKCSFPLFYQSVRESMVPGIAKKCQNTTLESDCSSDCSKELASLQQHPCMEGRLGAHAIRTNLSKMKEWNWIESLISSKKC